MYMYKTICIHMLLSDVYMNTCIRHRAFSNEACNSYSYSCGPLHRSETLLCRSQGLLGRGGLFWVGPCPEAGHGGCFGDITPRSRCLSLFLAACRFPSKVVKNNTSKRASKSLPNEQQGSPGKAPTVSGIMTKPTSSKNV